MTGEEPCMALTATRPIRHPRQRDTIDAPTMRTHNVQLLAHDNNDFQRIVLVDLDQGISSAFVSNAEEK